MPKGKAVFNAAADGKSAEVLLYGDIGGFWDGIDARQFAEGIKALGAIDHLNVRINSQGGVVSEGMAIYNTLANHQANVVTHIEGAALSIASVIAMAGDEVRMAESAMFMIHDPWTVLLGNAEEFRKEAGILDQIKATAVGVYTARTGKPAAEIAAAMAEETWYTGEEAKAAKFVDTLVPNKASPAVDQVQDRYKNAPAWAVARLQAQCRQIDDLTPWRRKLAERRLALLTGRH